jgi:hypothetical protein
MNEGDRFGVLVLSDNPNQAWILGILTQTAIKFIAWQFWNYASHF